MVGVAGIMAALDPEAPAGQALLAATAAIGFDPVVARLGLEAELDAWRAPGAAEALLADVPAWGRAPRGVLVIGARTLPVSTVRQVLLARLVGARVFVKTATGQEALAEALALADPEIVPAPFASDDGVAVRAALRAVEAVVVLGSDATVEAVRKEVRGQAFVGYGHRVSAAWFGPDATDADVRGLAEDVAAWDGAGCLAPKVVWVEGAPRALAERLAAALAQVTATRPLGPDGGLGAAHQLRAGRVEAIMRGGEAWVAAGHGPAYGVGTLPTTALRGSLAPRWIWVLPADIAALRAAEPMLSTLAVAGRALEGDEVVLGAHVRICAPGAMQRPTLAWRQDGHAPLGAIWVAAESP